MTRQFTVPIQLPEVAATPSTPASGFATLYAKADGNPYWLGDDGIEHPLIDPPPAALHDNPGFEGTWVNTSNGTPTIIGLTPPSWNTFWCADGVTISQEATQKTEGTLAVKMTRPAGANKGVRLHSSVVFGGLTPGDIITLEADAKSTVGGIFYTDMLFSDTSAGCDFFSGNPMTQAFNRPFTMVAGAAYRRCRGSFTVPAGCYFGRVSFHYDTTGDVTGSIYIDNSASDLTSTVSSVSSIDTYHGDATSDLNPVTGTPTLVPGTQLTIPSSGPSEKWLVVAAFDIQYVSGTTGVICGSLNIDGTTQPGGYGVLSGSGASSDRKTVHQNWLVTGLTAGNHTVQLRGHQTSGTGVYKIGTVHTGYSVTRLLAPQGAQGPKGDPGGGLVWGAWNGITRSAVFSAGTIRYRRSVDGSLIQLDISGLVHGTPPTTAANGNLSPDILICTLPADAWPDTLSKTVITLDMSETYSMMCLIDSANGQVSAYATTVSSVSLAHTGNGSIVYGGASR